MFTPNHEMLVMTFPKTAIAMRPRSFTKPPKRACNAMAQQMTISNAPFSFGSHPQNRPHD